MAYTPPNTFLTGTVIDSAAVQGNSDALRVYLHDGVVTADLRASRWADTRHVQSPVVDPYLGLQHGVTGHQGGQSSGAPLTRATLTTSYMTGGKFGAVQWIPVPGTAVRISVRRACTALFHFRCELIAGPDDSPNVPGRIPNRTSRLVTVAPYFGSIQSPLTSQAQDTLNNHLGWDSASRGPDAPYNIVGWGSKTGTFMQTFNGPGEFVFGVASFSQIDRVAFLDWAFSVETFYC